MSGARAARENDTARCIREARAERDSDAEMRRRCAHPANVEYALFFEKLQGAAVEKAGEDTTWSIALGKVAWSLCKLPTRVRHLEHANAVHGVGPKTLGLFRKYMDCLLYTSPSPRDRG